jgi:hypothetical protein
MSYGFYSYDKFMEEVSYFLCDGLGGFVGIDVVKSHNDRLDDLCIGSVGAKSPSMIGLLLLALCDWCSSCHHL